MISEDWRITTFLLCCYGFFKEIRPSEPFLTEYLISNHTGVTEQQNVYHDIYPVWTYSYLAILILVFLVTDLAKYKPVIIFEGFAYILTWILLLWGHGLTTMQTMQVSYGVATSTEVAYFTYIYASVSGEWYQQVTSFTRAALLLGRFLSGVLAQSLVCLEVCDFRDLNYISLAMVSVAAGISFFLPPVKNTIYFHTGHGESGMIRPVQNNESLEDHQLTWKQQFKKASILVKTDFEDAFKNSYILKWSLWWALGMCGNFQVGNYIQPLWEEIKPAVDSDSPCELYNGAVEAVTTLIGAGLALALGFTKFNWSIIGELTLSIISMVDALMLYLMATTTTISMGYAGYIVFRALYQMMITVASFEIASNISQNSYGLVFGFNTFLALGFQTILTSVVADSVGLALPPRQQFQVYAVFFLVVGLLFLLTGLITLARGGVTRLREEGVWRRDVRRGVNGSEGAEHPPVGAIECPQ